MENNIYTEADKNIRRTWVYITFFLLFIIGVGYFFSYLYRTTSILYFAVFFALFLNFFSYWYSDKIVLRLHRAVPITREANFDLYNIVENLSITAGLPMPAVYIITDSAPNAFATGRSKDHAALCVTSGLLSLLKKDELEGVIAHELSHIGNKDMILSTMVVVLAGFITMLSHIFLRGSFYGGGRDRDNEAGGILFIIGIVLAILAPIAATLIQLAISRKREFLADADGALLTRYPAGLANALKKIEGASAPLKTANAADAHLFISNPFGNKEGKASFLQKLFMTHPPTEERIEALTGKTDE